MKDFEWCTDCKEYDHEKHCCPRWTKVIRETMDDNINAVLEDIREEVYQMTLPNTHISKGNTWESIRYGVNLALEIIDKHIADMGGTE